MKGYIQTAVELADNWSWRKEDDTTIISYRNIDIAVDNPYYIQFALDALAAQLLRQLARSHDSIYIDVIIYEMEHVDTGNPALDTIIAVVETETRA